VSKTYTAELVCELCGKEFQELRNDDPAYDPPIDVCKNCANNGG
jgi:ribosome-binding protein aMBF1 (putative translation factor)